MNHINEFIKYLKFEKRYSSNTVIAYETDLLQFSEYLVLHFQNIDFDSLSTTIIRGWIVYLKDNGDQPRTVNRKITSLRSFYKFLIRGGLIIKNPMIGIKLQKQNSTIPEFIEEAAIERLFDNIEFGDNLKGALDDCIIELFYGTGIRLSELVNFKIKDFDLLNNNIKVLGKRNKERIIPINNVLRIKLLAYKRFRDIQFQDVASDFFFILPSGKKIYEKFVYRRINYYLSLVTTKTKKSPHVLRHTFATHMLNNGADLNIIKEILGHANLAATQVYTHNTIDKLKSIYKQAHPKA